MMVLRLLWFVLVYAGLIGGVAYGGYRGVKYLLHATGLGKKLLAEHRAQHLLEAPKDAEPCPFCGEKTNAQDDAYFPNVGWCHPKCYRDATNI